MTSSPWRPTRATGRWRFLADASAALDTSIEYEETLANTVRLAVPEVADTSGCSPAAPPPASLR